jgi:hypothetical protein
MIQDQLINAIKQIPANKLADLYDLIHCFRLGLASEQEVTHAQRPIGLANGQFRLPERFFAPLPDEILEEFEGKQ